MSETQIVAFGAVAIAVIGSLFTGILSIITILKTGKVADETKKVVVDVSDKNDKQTAKLGEIHDLVNGRFGALQEEVARVRKELASLTGSPKDIALSAKADKDVQVTLVASAVAAKEGLIR